MTEPAWRLALVVALGSIGLAASLSGVVGIIRMPDLYTRVQCATKNVTMGALPMLAAAAIARGPLSPFGTRALLVGMLLLVASPAASYSLVRAAQKVDVPMWDGAVADERVAHAADDPPRDAGGDRSTGERSGRESDGGERT